MKNLKAFEQHDFEPYYSRVIKNYGQPFPFSQLSEGDKLVYLGTPCSVVSVDEYILTLLPEGGKKFNVNQNMFNQKGFISRENKPINYKEA